MFEEQQEGKYGWSLESKRRVIGDEAKGTRHGHSHQGKIEPSSSFSECLLSAYHMLGTHLGSQGMFVNKVNENIIELHILMESKRL